MAIGDTLAEFVRAYNDFILSLPHLGQTLINLFVLVLLIVIYSVFIWKFRNFISTKNIFKFNLNKYNRMQRPLYIKLVAAGFFLLEYILIIPFIIFFWYSIFTFFLIMLTEESISVGTILIVSAIAIGAIRMSAYIPRYGQSLSQELAKILPFTFLAIAVLSPNIFINFLSRVSERLTELPLFFSGIINYLIFIIILEVILRLFEFLFSILGLDDDTEGKEDE